MSLLTRSLGQSTKILDIKEFVKKTDMDSTMTKGQPLDYKHPIFDSIKIGSGSIIPQFDSKGLKKVTVYDIREDVEEEWQFYYDANKLVYFDHFVIEVKKETNLIYEQVKALQGEKLFFDNSAIIHFERKQDNFWVEAELPDDEKRKQERDIVMTSDILKRSLKNN